MTILEAMKVSDNIHIPGNDWYLHNIRGVRWERRDKNNNSASMMMGVIYIDKENWDVYIPKQKGL